MMGSDMEGFIHTDDGVSLRYTARGAGQPGVLVHGRRLSC